MNHNEIRLMKAVNINCNVFVSCKEIDGFKTITVNGLGSFKTNLEATNGDIMEMLWDIFKVSADVGEHFSL